MIKFELTAVIPTQQYANIQPKFEVEAETYEEAMAIAEGHLRPFWNKYVEKGKELPDIDNRVKLEAYVGGSVWYNAFTHEYSNEAGEVYISGSVFAEQSEKPFDGAAIATSMAKKINAQPADILKMWKLKGEASRSFGDSIHAAMQLYEQFQTLSKQLGKTYHLHDNHVLKSVVESFYATHKEKAVSEILVVDHNAKRAGRIDRLELLGDKHGRVADYKTGKVEKKLPMYWRQLGFYSEIMETNGWKMEKPVIYGWNGEWKTYEP